MPHVAYVTGRLLSGESGSVVVDRATHEVYGHVVGSDALGHAYVVPLTQVLEQLKGFHDCAVKLAMAMRVDSLKQWGDLFTLQTTPEPSATTTTETVPSTQAQPYGELPKSRGDLPKSTGQTALDNKISSPVFSKDPGKVTGVLLDNAADTKGAGGEQGTALQAASSGGHKNTLWMGPEKDTGTSSFTDAEMVRSHSQLNSRVCPNT